ncbi:hypothetical protein J4217_02615 [Candidatus Pacearchaeota archaeon]|nr:hypothetical protein [Candidatus Pacearchaeota archaeon]
MTFFNIFSKKQEKKNSEENKKAKIIIDNREKNSLVISELINLGTEIELKQLQIADYLVNDVAVERKTINDLQSSIINKRIFSQLKDLKQYRQNLLIVEGDIEYSPVFIHENAFRGFLLSIALEYQIPIIFTKNEQDTAKYLLVLAKQTKNKESSLRESQTFKSKRDQIQFILEGFPGVGPIKAKALIKKFKSIKNIVNATEKELNNILGKKTSEFKTLIGENI